MKFLDEHDHRFVVFRKVLDARMKKLFSKGLGTKVRQADPILPEDEEKSGLVEYSGSTLLKLYSIQFSFCKIFGLRAFDEHRNLECSQFEIGQDEQGKCIRFTRRSCKTYKGGLKHLQLSNKDLKHYSQEGKLSLF